MKRIPPSTRFAAQIPGGERLSARHLKKGERGIWPRRFWEHAICDEGDYERQVDYLHYNPVKHGHVTRVIQASTVTFKAVFITLKGRQTITFEV